MIIGNYAHFCGLSTEPALGIVLNVAVGLTLVFLSFLSLSFWFYG